jgi:hypothetical protein
MSALWQLPEGPHDGVVYQYSDRSVRDCECGR